MTKLTASDVKVSIRVQTVNGRGRATLAIRLRGELQTVRRLRLELVHVLGVSTAYYPAAQQTVDVDLRALPCGAVAVRLTPELVDGQSGHAAQAAFTVPAGEGPSPALDGLHPLDPVLQRPTRNSSVVTRCELSVGHCATDGGTVFFRLDYPDGRISETHLPLPQGTHCLLRPFALDDGAPVGRYQLTAILVDWEGQMSAPVTAPLGIGDKGAAAPAITSVAWQPDDCIVVQGRALCGQDLCVLLDGVPVPIAEASAERLVLVAHNNLPARLVVATALGFAEAPRSVGPPPSLHILPEQASVAEGDSTQLHALVRGIANAQVQWSVAAAADVSISDRGLLRVGPGAPDRVLVRARVPGSRIGSTREVKVLAPRGEAPLIGRRGGVALGQGGAALTLPVGALTAPHTIQLQSAAASRPARGRVVAAEVTLTPTRLKGAATLHLPLNTWVEPGRELDLEQRRDGVWRAAGRATVDVSGFAVNLLLDQLPNRLRVLLPWLRDRHLRAQPRISSVRDTPIEEGDTVPIYVTGSNFVPGLTTVSVLRGGMVDNRVECRGVAIRQDGSAFGVTIAVGPLPELGEGMVSDHVLHVQTPAGSAEFALPIQGHDELIVAAGQTVSIDRPQRLSLLRIDAGGTLKVALTVPPVRIDVLGEAFIDGTIVVEAVAGSNGGRGANGGMGGGGGQASLAFGNGNGGIGGNGGANGSAAGSAGMAGSAAGPAAPRPGSGGRGGFSGGGGPFPHIGGFGNPGAAPPNPHIPFAGRSNLSPSVDAGSGIGAGGGGGGGGGGEGWVFVNSGGGGGGGGAGGGGLAVAAGSSIRLRGVVLALGGDGGNGGTAGAAPPSVWTLISAGGGAGAGGGGGGTILLQGIDRSWGATVLATSGKPGATLLDDAVRVDVRTLIEQAAAQDPSGDIRADGAIIGLVKPIATQGPDLLYMPQLVSTRNSIDVTVFNATQLRVANAFNGNQVVPVPQLISSGLNPDTYVGLVSVPLEVGFNSVVAEQEALPGVPALLLQAAAVRRRKILYLDQTLAFYAFSAQLTSASPAVATERSVSLAVLVTASQATPLLWSVAGGPDNGNVLAQIGGALYSAPSRPVDFTVTVQVASAFSPNLGAQVSLTVVPGVLSSNVATIGTPALTGLPSANCGQLLTLDVNPAALALTQQGFSQVPAVEFPRLMSQGSMCVRDVLPVPPTIATGLLSLTAEVPACADPQSWVRVAGHGSLRVQIVPVVNSLVGDRASSPDYFISGTGFACGDTQVYADGVLQVLQSITCGSLHMAQWPNHGASLVIRTSGGSSAPFVVT